MLDFKEKILETSNSYTFYKKGYCEYKKKYENEIPELIKKIESIQEDMYNNTNNYIELLNERHFSVEKVEKKKNEFYKEYINREKKLTDENNYLKNTMGNLTHYYTSRIDIKNNGTYNNKIEILSISDDDAKVTSPKWFSDEKGKGMQIQSSKGFLDLKLKIVSDGLLNIDLRSLNANYKRDKSLKVPIFIEYTSLKINGVESLKKYELVSHDDKYVHNVTVKNGEIIFVHLEWEPFKL